MPTEYDELVRDRIPAMIEADDETSVIRRVEGEKHGDTLPLGREPTVL